MSHKIEDIDIKINIINIENFNPNDIKIDKRPYKNILIYYIGYVKIKKYLKVYSVNPLYLIFRYVNGSFEEINKNRHLTLVSTNESKEKIKKYGELWSKIRHLIRTITKNLTVMIKNTWKSNLIHRMSSL